MSEHVIDDERRLTLFDQFIIHFNIILNRIWLGTERHFAFGIDKTRSSLLAEIRQTEITIPSRYRNIRSAPVESIDRYRRTAIITQCSNKWNILYYTLRDVGLTAVLHDKIATLNDCGRSASIGHQQCFVKSQANRIGTRGLWYTLRILQIQRNCHVIGLASKNDRGDRNDDRANIRKWIRCI